MITNTPFSKYHQTSKNNLIQNFYIIGFSSNDFFRLDQKEKTGEFADIFKENLEDIPKLTPKIITKFPNIKNTLNRISDDIVIDHCFPNGNLKIFKKSKADDNPKTLFQFELDNIPQTYQNDEQRIYSKIYFTCLEIGEPISEYFQYKKEIINLLFKYKPIKIINFDKNEPEKIDTIKKFSDFLMPKVLCFASVLPFYNELSLTLKCIYNYYLSKKDFSSLPLEKVIEKIIIETPIPLKKATELSINFKTSIKEKIIFPLYNINEINIKYSNDMSLVDLFRYFTSDEIIRIFKYIIYEIPLLFFSKNKSILSLFINTFLSVLSPFKYVFPHISLLPNKLYGLINSEQKFIFGINQNYDENFFLKNNIELDKTIVIVSINILDEYKKTAKINIEEKIFDINNSDKLIIKRKGFLRRKEDTILINGNITNVINVDIPNIYKKTLIEGISKYISFMKKKNFFSKKESIPKDFTFKIQNVFYKFFVNIMCGYTEFMLKSPSFYKYPRNIGEKMHFKHENNFLKEVFNCEDFIAKAPKDYQLFYDIFFKTKLFANFFYERIYNSNDIDQLALRQFDQLTFLKKHTEFRKKKENKSYFENFKKDIFDKTKVEKKEEINIVEENTFSNKDIFAFVTDEEKITDILLYYGQLIKVKDSNNIEKNEKNKDNYSKLIDINYCIFPKLLFEYLDIKSNNLIFLNDNYANNFKALCTAQKQEYEKIRDYAFYEKFFEKISFTINSNKSYIVYNYIYILYIWSILLSCCLWYCQQDEKNYRLDKLFEVINKMENIEEYVLNILFINIYNYGDKYHLIKFYMLYNKMFGSTNYYFLNLLCDKIKEKEINENNTDNIEKEEEQNDLILSKRYLIKLSEEFSQKRKSKLMRQSFISEDNEEIIFMTEQKCAKCNEKRDISPNELINNKNNLNEKKYKYNCPICKTENQDIVIKYQILIFNYKKKEAFITETGEFILLTPFKLYEDLKLYLIEDNNIKLGIKNIFDIKEKINLINILFYFHILNLSFDFLLPYVPKLNSSMKNLFFNNEELQENKILEKKVSEPIRITYKDEVSFVYRKFNTITPQYNLKTKSSFLFFSFSPKYVESELSFTIKNSKKKGKK